MQETDTTLRGLYAVIESRKTADPKSSYTARLMAGGAPMIAKKLGEEAVELALAAVGRDPTQVVNESADLLYHLLVLWAQAGIAPDQVYAELARRQRQSGLSEKASRGKPPVDSGGDSGAD
jgi:phosphoribosyl-ATP pyrophosphohydrolase